MINPLVSERAILGHLVCVLDEEHWAAPEGTARDLAGALADAFADSTTLSVALAKVVKIRQVTVAEAWQWAMAAVAYGTAEA